MPVALAADIVDVTRLKRMLALAAPPLVTAPPAPAVLASRYLRPATDYVLARPTPAVRHDA